jgi:preprotein translocase subunit SecE
VAKNKNDRKENPVLRYLRETRAELRRVRWPTREETWMMTKVVLAVMFGMAIFLFVVDSFFSWLLSGIVAQNLLFVVLGIIVVIALVASAYLMAQGEEV